MLKYQFMYKDLYYYHYYLNLEFFLLILFFLFFFSFLIFFLFFILAFIHSFKILFLFFILEIRVIRSAEYKLPIIREICICMFGLYIKMKVKKNVIVII